MNPKESDLITAAEKVLHDHDGLTSDRKHVLVRVEDFEDLEDAVNDTDEE